MSGTSIVISRANRAKLRTMFKATDSVLSLALSFKYNSLLGRRIRSVAVNELNGIIVKNGILL